MTVAAWTADDLARELGYRKATPAFWRYCARIGLRTIPGKAFVFDVQEACRAIERAARVKA